MAGTSERPSNAISKLKNHLLNLQSSKKEAIKLEAEVIRQYTRSQVDLWMQVPNLALEADGRGGYNDNSKRAYLYKIYPISEGKAGYKVCVDLLTGDLIMHPWSLPAIKKTRIAPDEMIVTIDEKYFDAKRLVDRYREWSNESYFKGYNPRKIAQWRADIRAGDPFLTKTIDPELSIQGQAKKLNNMINKIKDAALVAKSELTIEQVENAIRHVLKASNYDDQDLEVIMELDINKIKNPVTRSLFANSIWGIPRFRRARIDIRGAQELMQSVGFYIRTKSTQFGAMFDELSYLVWHTAVDSAAIVRHEYGIKDSDVPEWTYIILGEEYVKRAGGDAANSAKPRTDQLTPNTVIGKTGAITAADITDWMLNEPVS